MALTSSPKLSSREFTIQERRALRVLRIDYRERQDLFSAKELDHLRFVRWLRQTNRLSAEA